MHSAADHYQNLLAQHYTWMFGVSFEEKVAEQKALLTQILADSSGHPSNCAAIDLGSGPGFQSIALAELGFSPVVAIDSSTVLLAELNAHAGHHAVETREADLASLAEIDLPAPAAIAVCMGDTLTHLSSKKDVEALFDSVFKVLAPAGIFAITYRDLTTELTGLDRFIPVRSDDNKIMTCFLESEQGNPDVIFVHDLIYVRDQKTWTLNKSSYRKLRLAAQWVAEALISAGFTLQSSGPVGRLTMLIARKP